MQISELYNYLDSLGLISYTVVGKKLIIRDDLTLLNVEDYLKFSSLDYNIYVSGTFHTLDLLKNLKSCGDLHLDIPQNYFCVNYLPDIKNSLKIHRNTRVTGFDNSRCYFVLDCDVQKHIHLVLNNVKLVRNIDCKTIRLVGCEVYGNVKSINAIFDNCSFHSDFICNGRLFIKDTRFYKDSITIANCISCFVENLLSNIEYNFNDVKDLHLSSESEKDYKVSLSNIDELYLSTFDLILNSKNVITVSLLKIPEDIKVLTNQFIFKQENSKINKVKCKEIILDNSLYNQKGIRLGITDTSIFRNIPNINLAVDASVYETMFDFKRNFDGVTCYQ